MSDTENMKSSIAVATGEELDNYISILAGSPATSYWLRNSLAASRNRDILDMLHDVECLEAILKRRFQLAMKLIPASQFTEEHISLLQDCPQVAIHPTCPPGLASGRACLICFPPQDPDGFMPRRPKPEHITVLPSFDPPSPTCGLDDCPDCALYQALKNPPDTDPARQFLLDIMSIAIEGGINDWADCNDIRQDTDGVYLSYAVRDYEDRGAAWQIITPEKIEQALDKIANPDTWPIKIGDSYRYDIIQAYSTLDAGMIDAMLADIIVQVAAYGEIVFG